MGRLPVAVVVVLAGAWPARAEEADWPRTPKEFLARGVPTFVRGTLGDDAADRRVVVEIERLRATRFPGAPVVGDVSIDVSKGLAGWPANPVLVGGAHVNAVVKVLSSVLPFETWAGVLRVGEQRFEGDEHRVVAVVPPRRGDDHGPAHPPLLVFAGAGSPGVTDLSSIPVGGDGLVVLDRFGPVLRAQWRATTGAPRTPSVLTVETPIDRPRWSWTGEFDGAVPPIVKAMTFAAELPERPDEGNTPDPIGGRPLTSLGWARAVGQAFDRLGGGAVVPIRVHLYRTAKRKLEVTGRDDDAHADLASRTVHVVLLAPDAVERLVVREAARVLVDAWGPVAAPVLREGLPVWAAGEHGGKPLLAWRKKVPAKPGVEALFGDAFLRVPPDLARPTAALLVETLVTQVGIDGLRAHFLDATPATWAKACERAGTTPEAVEKTWRRR